MKALNTIDTFDKVAKTAALRAVANSALARAISTARAQLRSEEIHAREGWKALDERNSRDEEIRYQRDADDTFGFSHTDYPAQIEALMGLYEHCSATIGSDNKWDLPMSMEQMLDFFVERAERADPAMVEILAKTLKAREEDIRRLAEVSAQEERTKLLEQIPSIKAMLSGHTPNDAPSIDPVSEHQITLKVVEALSKAKERTLLRIIRSRKLTLLGDIPLLDDAIEQMREVVKQLESQYANELQEALDAGRSVRTLEDVA